MIGKIIQAKYAKQRAETNFQVLINCSKFITQFGPPKPRGLGLADESVNCFLDSDLLFLLAVPGGAYNIRVNVSTVSLSHNRNTRGRTKLNKGSDRSLTSPEKSLEKKNTEF